MHKHSPKRNSGFRFDAALSFDGRHREKARIIAKELKRAGLARFLDEEHQAALWGKDESEFERIYGPDSRFFIPLVSKEYVSNIWTRHEFELARREAAERDHIYILPIRVDDTPLLGLPEGTLYISYEKVGPERIAELVRQKVEQIFGDVKGTVADGFCVLESDARFALGILVTAAFPRQIEYYKRLLPSIAWDEIVPDLEALGLIDDAKEIPTATEMAEQAYPVEASEYQLLNEKWIDLLEPLQHHIDIAPALAIHLMHAERTNDAAELLAEVATGIELGWWNDIYLNALEAIVLKRLSSLPKETKFKTLNGYGICLSHAGRHQEAIKIYKKLRASAKRASDDYWIGQSLINQGVAEFRSGSQDASIKRYEEAKTLGESIEDWQLVARCLGNLAESFHGTNPAKSREMLSESIKLKKKVNDEYGLAAAEMQIGNLEASIGQPVEAIPHFRKAASLAAACGDRHLESLAMFNLGNAHYELGRNKKAISYYAKSLEIAEEDGYDDCIHYAAIGMGRAAFGSGRLSEAKSAFEILLESSEDAGELEDQMCSLHGLAVIEKITVGEASAKTSFSKALRFARSNELYDWYARCIADRTRLCENSALGSADLGVVSRKARELARKGDHAFAGHLYFLLARHLAGNGEASPEDVDHAYESALNSLQESDERDELVQVLLEYSDWTWQHGEFESSIDLMCRAELLAIDIENMGQACEAADQIGVRMQHLGRFEDAVVCHQRAVKLARKCKFVSSLEAFLNNLGEALRHTKKFEQAEDAFLESEEIASAIDEESVISTAHNRALTYQDSGDHDRAESLFKRLRDQSRRQGLWKEYVKAIEALANLAWVQRDYGLARRRYVDAIKAAKKRKLKESLPRLALNFAELEIYHGEPNLAVRELKKIMPQVKLAPNEHLYHQVLGRAYAVAAKPKLAIEPLREATELALATGDSESGLRALGELANALEQLGRTDEAVETLERIVEREPDPEMKVAALDQLLILQLSIDDDAAQSTYDRAFSLIEKHDLAGGNADIHLTIGIHYWTTNEEDKKLEALQSFVIAVTHALIHDASDSNRAENDSLCGEVNSEIVRLLTHPDTAVSEPELASLVDEVTAWVNMQIGLKFWRKTALTPILLAQNLLPLKDQPRNFINELDRLIESGKYFS